VETTKLALPYRRHDSPPIEDPRILASVRENDKDANAFKHLNSTSILESRPSAPINSDNSHFASRLSNPTASLHHRPAHRSSENQPGNQVYPCHQVHASPTTTKITLPVPLMKLFVWNRSNKRRG